MEGNKKRRRRRHPADFKARVVAACQVPGASLAGVALEWQLNANLLRRWVKEALVRTALISGGETSTPEKTPTFVPVAITGPKTAGQAERPIRVQVRKRGLRITIDWPVVAAGTCAQWLRELLE
jgi:transposase-like protein